MSIDSGVKTAKCVLFEHYLSGAFLPVLLHPAEVGPLRIEENEMRVQQNEVLTVEQVAQTLGVAEKSVRVWIKAGKLGHFRAGRLMRVHRLQLQAYMTRNGVDPQDLDPATPARSV